jgi:excinuclease ABC subunit C
MEPTEQGDTSMNLEAAPERPESPLEKLEPRLRELLDRLPKEAGVYLLKDKSATIIYVGKAKSLYSRVRSYFLRSGDERAFVPLLAHVLDDIETIVTQNEKEALLLENNLIKKHKPRFNVMMRDDKNFLVLRLDPKAYFPRLEVLRRIGKDRARYFGPYHSASSCRETLRIVNRYFQLRTCSDRTLKSRQRACLQHQIGRCPAPCVKEVDQEVYGQQVDDVTLFLRGRQEELIESLQIRMHAAAEQLNFELAAGLRDQIAAVKRTLQKQEVVGHDLVDQDVFGFYRQGDAVDFVVLVMRQGKLVGRHPYSFSGQEFPDQELLSSFITQFYERGQTPPKQLLVPLLLEGKDATAEWLSELAGHRVDVLRPQRGHKRKLIELAARNAQSNFVSRRKQQQDLDESLGKMQRRLRLSRLPRHIECYDISQHHAQNVVASMVVMRDGEPDHSSYRHFTVRGKSKDDFASLYEVLARRFRRARQKDEGWQLPDLIVIDGGKGQLGSALAALRDAGLPQEMPLPDMVGLAKERFDGIDAEKTASDDGKPHKEALEERDRPDRVFLPNVKDPVRLRPNTPELFLLSRLRDEAHRFAITHHRKLRHRTTFRSVLDDIPGIGKRRKQLLLKELGSLKNIKEASLERLAAVSGMTQKAAEQVARYFSAAELGAEAGGQVPPEQTAEIPEMTILDTNDEST